MKRKLLPIFIALASIMYASAATIVPTTSTSGNDVWYMIRVNPRDAANPLRQWLSVDADGRMNYSTLTGDDTQYWKVVENGTGLALVNKAGKYLNADHRGPTRMSVVDVAPTTPLRIVPASGYTGRYYNNSATVDVSKLGVFVVDNTAATTVDATNLITYTTPANAFALTIYGPTSGDILVTSQPAWGSGNTNQIVIFRTQTEVTADLKGTLLAAIARATTLYNNTTNGFNPGQYDADTRDGLLSSIEYSQGICDDVNSTVDDYVTATIDLNSIVTLFSSQVILPKLSTSSDNWYYIQGTRPANTYMTAPAAGAGTQVKDLAVIPDDTQLWRLVANGDGFAMQNKASLEYMQTDFPTGTNLSTQATMPTKALRFIASTETTNKATRFWLENTTSSTEALRLHAGAAGNGWGVMNWTGGANDNCTWLFLSVDDLYRTQFTNAINDARSLYNASVSGVEFGQYDATIRSTFNTLIAAEEAKDIATMTKEELIAGTKTLNDATAAYNCNGDVSTLSSVTKYKWFRLVNAMQPATGYAAGKAMTSTGRTADTDGYQGKYTFLAKDVNSDDQLFRFEMNADATKATTLVNKSTKKYVAANGAIVSTPTLDNEFEITRLDNQSFWIKPTTANPLHAAYTNSEILNWNAAAGSASAWKLEYVSSEDVADFTSAYTTTRTSTRAKFDAATLVKGDQISQYTNASVNALGVVITAEETKNIATLTQEQMLQGINDMKAAVAALAINTDIKTLVSATPNTIKWFRVINAASASVAYATGKVMSSNGRIETEAFTFEDKDINSDAQLFKFELNADQTKVANMINKANNLFMAANGVMAAASTANNEFEITQLSGGRSFWIHPTLIDATDPANPFRVEPLHAAESGTMIVNWNAGAGSASAWVFEFVKEEATAVKNVEAFTYRVRRTNHIITIDGVENFEVYSVLGQKQNSKKALNSGVYFVKVNNAVKKVIID